MHATASVIEIDYYCNKIISERHARVRTRERKREREREKRERDLSGGE